VRIPVWLNAKPHTLASWLEHHASRAIEHTLAKLAVGDRQGTGVIRVAVAQVNLVYGLALRLG